MLSSLFFATILAAVAVRADPNPEEPSPGDVFNEGSTCNVSWDPDTSGVWTTMNIELMCGDNFNMVYMTTVATVDGTDATKTSFSYPCPQVTPNSPIYFYQFTSPNSANETWTGRFAIADASGSTTPAANATQPDGEQIPWGIGKLVDETAAPEPSKGAGTGAGTATVPPSGPAVSSAATAATESSGAAATPGPSASSSPPTVPGSHTGPSSVSSLTKSSMVAVPTSSSVSANGTGSKNTTGDNAASGAVAGVSMSSRLTQAISALVVVGAAFTVVL